MTRFKDSCCPRQMLATTAWMVCWAWLAVSVAPQADAATLAWDPAGAGGGDGTWDITTASWDSGGSAVAWSNGTNDTASFAGSAGTVTLGEAITAAGLTFTSDGYTVTGGTLTLSGGGAANVGSGLSATLASGLSAADGIEKTGAGMLTVSGAYADTGTGVITVTEGTLRMAQTGLATSGSNGWGSGRPVVVAAGATLESAVSANVGTFGRQVTLNGGTLNLTAQTVADSLNYVNNLVLNNGASVIGNAMRMAYYTDGLVTVGGTSASTISAGIVLAKSGVRTATFDVADATSSADADLTITGVIRDLSGATSGTPLIKNGVGTMLLSGTNTYSGQTTVNAGTLVGGVGTSFAGGTAAAFGTGDVVVNEGATITGNTFFSVTGGRNTTRRVTLNGGTWDMSYADSGAEYVRYLDMTAGTVTADAAGYFRSAVGGLEITTFAAATSSVIQQPLVLTQGSLTLNAADGAAADDIVMQGFISGSGFSLTKQGAGTAVLTATSSYTSGTAVEAGVLQIGSSSTGIGGVLPTAGNTAISVGATLRFAHGAASPVYNGTLSGAGTLEVAGSGGTSNDLQLAGNNASFTGPVEIAGGHLRAANAAALSAANAVTISDSGILSVFAYGAGNQYDITIGSLASADATTLVRIGGSTNRSLTVGDATSTTYAGQIRNDAGGTGAMVKVGSGTLTLTGVNDFSGGLSISEGTLVAGNADALGSGSVTIASGAFLEMADGVTVANSLSLAGGAISRPSSVGSTVAEIVAGSAGNAVSLAPVMSWAAGTPGTNYSDVLSLTNTSGVAQVLSMTFDPTGLDQATIDSLELGWFDTLNQSWVGAIDGNSSGTPAFFSGSWADYLTANPAATPTTALGVYGRDTASNTAWAVIDHNSDFSVVAVPEPSAVVLAAGLAVLPVLLRRRRRRAA
jgi:fibronectin-binding autotransporter adhesin